MENKRSKAVSVSLLTFVICLLPFALFSQHSKYWIQFTDKNNSPYSISNPSAFLTARSIQRRANQGITLVQNDLPVNPAYIDSVSKVLNVTVLNRSKWFNAITIYTTDTNALNTIKAFSFVNATQPVKRLCRNLEGMDCASDVDASTIKFPLKEESTAVHPTDTKKLPQVNSLYNYGLSFNQVDMLGGVCMHDLGFSGKGMVIAILDIGFDHADSAAAFDSLRANNQILGTWNFVDGISNVYTNGDVHGTWCLSLMAGNIPGKLIGTAPKANYWLLRTEDGASENVIEEDNWVSGAEFADSVGADVLSTSLGYTEFDSVHVDSVTTIANPASHTYADMNGNTTRISIGSDIAASKGMLPVSAAGNSGWNPWHYIGAPADADSVLAVASVDSLKNRAGYSSFGPSYDGRIKPNVAAQGDRPYITDLYGGTYNPYGGTSFACPLTAGMATCLWQAHPAATNMQIYHAIEQAASQYLTPDSLTGYGIPDFCKAHTLLMSVHENANADVNVLTVYPNPFSESTVVSVQGVQANGLQLEVYDMLGKIVYQQMLNSQSVTLDLKLSQGVYTLQVRDANRSYAAKLVKY